MSQLSLAYKDRFVAKLVQDLSAYSEGSCESAVPQIISGEENYVILKVSLEEWTRLFSSVYTGADFCYPNDSDNVRWILQRAVECPVSICDLIIDCIQNNPATMQAIIDGLKASDDFNDFITEKIEGMTIEALTGELIYGSCDDPVVAGKMMALVDRLDLNNLDAIQIIEVGTNDEENVAALLEGIPLFGELPIGDIIEYSQSIIEQFGENYEAASTVERREETARLLWCLAGTKEDCKLTYEDLFTFFQERVGSGLTLESLLTNVMSWLISGDFPTDDLVFNGMMAFQIAMIRIGKDFFGINAVKIGVLTRDAEPSSIWEEWDPCIPPVEECEEFNTADHWYWQPDASDYGAFDAGGMKGVLYVPDGQYYFRFRKPSGLDPRSYASITLEFNEPKANVTLRYGTYIMAQIGSTPATSITADESSADPAIPFPFDAAATWTLRVAGDTVSETFRVGEQCFIEGD